jgi:alkylhydroperoxidase family enzyme
LRRRGQGRIHEDALRNDAVRGFFTHQQREVAVTVNNDPQSIRDGDYDRLRQLGLDDHLILEAISIAAFSGATNRIGIALAVPPSPEYTGVPGR